MDISSSENTLVIGSEGVIGNALCNQLEKTYEVHRISRKNCDYSEPSLKEHAQKMSQFGKFKIIICTIGVLHDDIVKPEKRLNDINPEQLSHYFFVNTILPMMVIKHFSPLLDSKTESCFVCLSAMVGSTSDNQLGGWYGYRASKAALNSLIKTSSIELSRNNKQSCVVAIHPGTTIGDLSAPYATRINPRKYYTPEKTAKRVIEIIENLEASKSGQFLNWNGKVLPW